MAPWWVPVVFFWSGLGLPVLLPLGLDLAVGSLAAAVTFAAAGALVAVTVTFAVTAALFEGKKVFQISQKSLTGKACFIRC